MSCFARFLNPDDLDRVQQLYMESLEQEGVENPELPTLEELADPQPLPPADAPQP
jgi:hypothetical protein